MAEYNQNQQLSTLIQLLDDPDYEVYNQVSKEILNTGIAALEILENAWLGINNELHRTRIEDLIHDIQFQEVFGDFKKWCQAGAIDLLEGYLIACRLRYPNLIKDSVVSEIEILTRQVWLELNDNLTSVEKVKILNHILFGIHGIGGEYTDSNNPDTYFLNHLVQTRHGNAVSIGILYIIVAQKLELPVYGVDLPGNFIVCYTHPYMEISNDFSPVHQVKFYINPLSGGAIFSRKEITFYLEQANMEAKPSYFNPASNKAILRRWFTDLLAAMQLRGELSITSDIEELLKLLDNS